MLMRRALSSNWAPRSAKTCGHWFRPCCLVLGVWASLAAPSRAAAQTMNDPSKAAARDHFDRGLRLFNQLDNEGALLEFTRAYELVPHVEVLRNIGLVYAAMHRPVQSVETFDRLLANPAGLDGGSMASIRTEREHQFALVTELDVKANVSNAIVEVDGIDVGRTPLRQPLKIAKGTHVLSVQAAGYVPLRRQLELVGSATTGVDFELLPADAALAHLVIRSRIPGVILTLDGESVGQTPLAASLATVHGAHRLEARRPGYRTVTYPVQLGPGTEGALDINPEVDSQVFASTSGYLTLAISEPDALVFVDGDPRGPYTSPLQLVSGAHLLRIEHPDFFPVERSIAVLERATSHYVVELKPTPQKLERYQAATRRRSTWGWITTTTGGVLTAASGGFLWYNHGVKSDKKAVFDGQVARAVPGGACDPAGIQQATCRTELQIALDNLEQARGRDVFGWVGLGVGGAALGFGLYLLLGNDDPERYAPKPQSDVFAKHRLTTVPWIGPNATGAALLGVF